MVCTGHALHVTRIPSPVFIEVSPTSSGVLGYLVKSYSLSLGEEVVIFYLTYLAMVESHLHEDRVRMEEVWWRGCVLGKDILVTDLAYGVGWVLVSQWWVFNRCAGVFTGGL